MAASNPWFYVPVLHAAPEIRLFCFPYAGGSAAMYRKWAKLLPTRIELWGVEPPGRLSRTQEAPFSRLRPLLDAFGPHLEPLMDEPFAFYGHSMGATIAFMLTSWLAERRLPMPRHLFLSARRAPHRVAHGVLLKDLSDDAFIEQVIAFGATPDLILQEPDLMELFLPLLRADFELSEDPDFWNVAPVETDITVFSATGDPILSPKEVDQWRSYTNGTFCHHTVKGDHFFVDSEKDQLISLISKALVTPGGHLD